MSTGNTGNTPPTNVISSSTSWLMGLTAFPAILANMTAIGLICLMFWNSQADQRQQAKEDRAMFREELRQLHDDSTRKWEVLRENQRATTELANAVKNMAEEPKALKSSKPK